LKSIFLRLAGLLLLIGSFASAAPQGSAITAKEIAQGYRDSVVLAMPRASVRATVDAAEAGEGLHIRRKFARFGDLRVLELKSTETVTQAVKRLQATGRYEYVEPDNLIHALSTPIDPYFSSEQWSLSNTGSNGPGNGVAGADIGAIAAWNTITDASSVIVAVVESGARLTHQDLASNLWSNPSTTAGVAGTHGIDSTVSNTRSGYYEPIDQAGHGTHVSGIIGAVGNNPYGIAVVAWKAQLMELKFIAANGYGSESDEVNCIDFAISNGAKVINASFGSNTYSNSEFDVIQKAGTHGIIFVAAAGNASLNNDTAPFYPADYPLDNIVSVAATDNTDALASFSDYGPGSVDLAAPGSAIFSTYYETSSGAGSDAAYATLSGTSMAAPHVTGAVALLLAKFPTDTYRQTINRLLRSVTPIAGLSGKVQTGGRLNLANAITSTSNTPFNDSFASRAMVATLMSTTQRPGML
jgi:subtilisin family serine protease